MRSRPASDLTEVSLDMFNMIDEGISSQASNQRLENRVNRTSQVAPDRNKLKMSLVQPMIDYLYNTNNVNQSSGQSVKLLEDSTWEVFQNQICLSDPVEHPDSKHSSPQPDSSYKSLLVSSAGGSNLTTYICPQNQQQYNSRQISGQKMNKSIEAARVEIALGKATQKEFNIFPLSSHNTSCEQKENFAHANNMAVMHESELNSSKKQFSKSNLFLQLEKKINNKQTAKHPNTQYINQNSFVSPPVVQNKGDFASVAVKQFCDTSHQDIVRQFISAHTSKSKQNKTQKNVDQKTKSVLNCNQTQQLIGRILIPDRQKKRPKSTETTRPKPTKNFKYLRPKTQTQEHSDLISEFPSRTAVEIEDLRADLHSQRLRNADHRQQISRMLRQIELKEKEQQETKVESLKLQVQRERDHAIYKQHQLNYEKLEQKQRIQEQEMRQIQKVLAKTIEIKMQYEIVLQELMEDPTIVNQVLKIIQDKNLII